MATKELTSRQKQAIDTKRKIYEVTMQLGMKHGFDSLEINGICQEASVSVGTFYHYYNSLDAVFQEEYKAYDNYISEAMKTTPLSGSSIEKLWQLFSLKYLYITTRGVEFIARQYRGQFAQISTANSFFFSPKRIMNKTVLSIIRTGIANGEFSVDVSPEMLANALLMFSRGITIDWSLRNGGYDLNQVALRNLNLIMRQFVK